MKILKLAELLKEIEAHKDAKRKVYTVFCQGDWRKTLCRDRDVAEFEYIQETNIMKIGVIV